MIQIGVRAHDFGTLPPAELAKLVAASGASCIQLALAKALSGVPVNPTELGAEGARAIKAAFAQQGVSIAVLGCYINPVHPDEGERDKALKKFEAHLRLAHEFGCRLVGTETGSIAPNCSYHPDTAKESTFRTLVQSVRRLADVAEQTPEAMVAVEAVAHQHTISTAKLMRRLLEEVGSKRVGVIFDPTNLVPLDGLADQDAFLDECFESFGERIVALHAKDYVMEQGPNGLVKSGPLPAGTGLLDWVGIFRRLRAAGKADVPVLLENAGPDHSPGAIKRLREAFLASQQ